MPLPGTSTRSQSIVSTLSNASRASSKAGSAFSQSGAGAACGAAKSSPGSTVSKASSLGKGLHHHGPASIHSRASAVQQQKQQQEQVQQQFGSMLTITGGSSAIRSAAPGAAPGDADQPRSVLQTQQAVAAAAAQQEARQAAVANARTHRATFILPCGGPDVVEEKPMKQGKGKPSGASGGTGTAPLQREVRGTVWDNA